MKTLKIGVHDRKRLKTGKSAFKTRWINFEVRRRSTQVHSVRSRSRHDDKLRLSSRPFTECAHITAHEYCVCRTRSCVCVCYLCVKCVRYSANAVLVRRQLSRIDKSAESGPVDAGNAYCTILRKRWLAALLLFRNIDQSL